MYISEVIFIHDTKAVNNLMGMELQRVVPGQHGNFDKMETCRKTTVNDFLQSTRQSKISGRNKSRDGAVKRPLQGHERGCASRRKNKFAVNMKYIDWMLNTQVSVSISTFKGCCY